MGRALIGTMLLATAAPTLASAPVETVTKRIELYDRCMTLAAIRATFTNAADHEIYGIARAACAAARDGRTLDRSRQPLYLAAIDAADAARAANLPGWVSDLRNRRRATGPGFGTSSH